MKSVLLIIYDHPISPKVIVMSSVTMSPVVPVAREASTLVPGTP